MDSIFVTGYLWWFASILCVLPLLSWIIWSWNEYRFTTPLGPSAKLPPGNMGLPYFGELLTFLWYFKIVGRPDDFINSKRKRYGDDGLGMYRTHLFGAPAIIASSPAFNKFVLQSPDLFSISWPSTKLVGDNALVAVHGKAHSRIRSYVYSVTSSPEALKNIAQMVQPRIVSSLKALVQKGTLNALDEIKKITFENIGMMFVSLEPGPLLDTIDKCFAGVLAGLRAQPLNLPGTTYHHALKCREKLTEIFGNELEQRKRKMMSMDRTDLMDGLIKLKDEEGNQLRDEEVVDNIVSLVLAGYESTSLATMWAMFLIAKNPEVLQKLRDENIAAVKKKEGEFITSQELSQLSYTNKVVEETIRMANIAPLVFRQATQDVEYKGYKIPKDWRVIVWLRHLHTDPNNFENPMSFNPDRWSEPAKPGTYQVFGGGPRICVANSLARIQLAIFLHHLAIGYRWELINPDAKIIYLPNPMLADGVTIKFSAI